jgi:signal transduction histidine kinase/CheY-like chemotaxis protein
MAHINSTIRQEILSQAQVRLVICSFMGIYYLFFGVENHPVYLVFVAYTVTLFAMAKYTPSDGHPLLLITVLLDNGFAILGLHVTGESGTFLLFFLIHISFAYGLRFGRRYLVISLVVSIAGVSWLFYASSPWQGRIHFLLSFLFGMPFIALYVYGLTGKLRASEARAIQSSLRTKNLLAFLSHDIRAPLHLFLEASKDLQSEPLSPRGRAALFSIERMVEFTERMVAEVLVTQLPLQSTLHESQSKELVIHPMPLAEWIVGFFEMFRGQIEARGATLEYRLDGPICLVRNYDRAMLERVLLNVMSNAIRHCKDGAVLVTAECSDSSTRKITISVANTRPSDISVAKTRVRSAANWQNEGFSGAGLGLVVADEAASTAGASFSFEEVSDGHFLSAVRFDTDSEDDEIFPHSPVMAPVVIKSSDPEDWICGIRRFARIANVYWSPVNPPASCDRISHSESIGPPLFIYMHSETDCSCDSSVANSDFLSPNLQVAHAVPPSVETITIEGPKIHVFNGASDGTWLAAVLIAGAFRKFRPPTRTITHQSAHQLAGCKILALDDNIFNLKALARSLKKHAIRIVPASTVAEATENLRAAPFDLFIVDWNIGLTTAAELLEGLSLVSRNPTIKILILSGEDVDLNQIPHYSLGLIRKLVKPVASEVVFREIVGLMLPGSNEESVSAAYSPSEIFNCTDYLTGNALPELGDVVESLLVEFLETLRETARDWSSMFSLKDDAESKARHRLTSMCYSAGAYALGDCLKSIGTNSHSPNHFSPLDARPEFLHLIRVHALTELHVVWFLESLRHRRLAQE